ncbi:MAG: ATP-binding protein [Anaerolineae bacterium]
MTLTNNLLQQILDAIDSCVLVFRGSQVVMVNHLALNWLSMSESVLKSQPLDTFIHSQSREVIREVYQSLRAGQAPISVRLAVVNPTRGNVWIDATIKAADFFNESDTWLVTFIPTHMSVTEYLEPQVTLDTTVIDINKGIGNHPILTELLLDNRLIDTALEDFFTTLHDIIPYDSASIALLDGDRMRFIAARGFPPEINLSELSFTTTHSFTKTGEILYQNTQGAVQVIKDTENHPAWVMVDQINHIKSWMGVELRYEGRVLGTLNIDSSVKNFFTRDHARYALALSQQAIIALIYTRLYKQFYDDYEERQQLQQVLIKNLINTETMYAAQDLLFSMQSFAACLPELITIVGAAMEHTQIGLIIFDLKTGELIHKVSPTEHEADFWHIFRMITGMPNLPEESMPPLDINLEARGILRLTDGRLVTSGVISRRGALIAIREPDAVPFDEIEHELIVTIANQISIALENETLYAQLQQHTQNLERLVERRTAQLSVERKRLKAILDSTAEGIFYMENFRIQYANPAFCNMVGYGLDDLYGKPLSYVRVTPDSKESLNFSSLLTDPLIADSGRNETRLRHRDGTEFYASIRFSLVGQPGEDSVRIVAIARDISQERKLYIQRARFITNAAHELRNPISSLILRLHMLHRQPERMQTHLESLDHVTNYLKELVEELLTLARFERGSIILDKDDFVLQSLIQQGVNEHQPFAEIQGVTMLLSLPDEPVAVKVDGKRIHQMIANLVVNGINYSDQGDTVEVSMVVEVDTAGNKNAIIYIVDQGAGIDPDLLPDDIFEPFARPSGGSRKETGMGLALAREIITLHGGTIHARSQPGEGSSFRLVLPIN